MRKTLSGGARIVDTGGSTGVTILQKAFASADGSSSQGTTHITGSTLVAGATPFKWNDSHTLNNYSGANFSSAEPLSPHHQQRSSSDCPIQPELANGLPITECGDRHFDQSTDHGVWFKLHHLGKQYPGHPPGLRWNNADYDDPFVGRHIGDASGVPDRGGNHFRVCSHNQNDNERLAEYINDQRGIDGRDRQLHHYDHRQRFDQEYFDDDYTERRRRA